MNAIATVPEHVAPERVFDFDIYADPRVTDDVQGSYAQALSAAPDIFWTPRNGGHWMIKSFETITEIHPDFEHFSVREMQIPRVPNPPFFIPLSLDPPANIPYRHAMTPLFSPKAVKELEPKLRGWAARIVESVAAKGECEFVHEVSSLFPVSVFMEMMGMDLSRLHEFRELADEFFKAQEPEKLERVSGEIIALVSGLIQQRRTAPGSDVVSYLQAVEVDGRKFSDDELRAMCFILFLGGMDTVTNLTSFAFQHLAGDPELQARLAADFDLIPKFIEESLRCFGVVHTPRLVVKDYERFGVRFREGEMILTCLPVAGRDPRVNPDPMRFDIDRAEPMYRTFGLGPHICIGHNLARAEMRVLLEEWLTRIPRFEAKPGTKHGFRTGTVMALLSLPLTWQAT